MSALTSDGEWDKERSTSLPTGSQLARCLADMAAFPSDDPNDRDDLAKVASYYVEAQADRPALLSCLRGVFDRDYPVGEVHRFLADLPVPLLIVTTNYDDLIEKAFRDKSRPFHLVAHPTDRKDLAASVLWWRPNATEPIAQPPNKLKLSLKDTTIIYKMHGSVDRRTKRWDSFVITEEDYVEFLARMTGQSAIPSRFKAHFRESRFLFLGYGLRDWNLRVMMNNLKAKPILQESEAMEDALNQSPPEAELRSWAIQYLPSNLEESLWDARRVNIYNIKIDDFIARMREYAK